MSARYECLKIRVDRGVAWVTIDHPPINLFDRARMLDIHHVGKDLGADPGVRVVVFDGERFRTLPKVSIGTSARSATRS